ncbi:MAG: hypothetical protein ACYCPN_04465 [Thermoplasmata archaeon]
MRPSRRAACRRHRSRNFRIRSAKEGSVASAERSSRSTPSTPSSASARVSARGSSASIRSTTPTSSG